MIFVSYSRDDSDFVRDLTYRLRSRGFPVYRDPPLVEGNPFWRDEVRRTLDLCGAMVVAWSAAAATSPWVEHEVRSYSGPRGFVRVDRSPVPRSARRQVVDPDAAEAWLRSFVATGDPRGEPGWDGGTAEARRAEIDRQHERLSAFVAALRGDDTPESVYSDEWATRDGSRMRRVRVPEVDVAWVSTVPITNEQYRSFVEATDWPPPPTWSRTAFREPRAPVVGVTWFEAGAYACWAGADLPTEAEWLAAASGGRPGVRFATADDVLSPDRACYGKTPGTGQPDPVDMYPPNPNGFSGMCGNTWDWCLDADGTHRVIRGGGYMDSAAFCRLDARYRNSPIDRDCCVGFRLAARS